MLYFNIDMYNNNNGNRSDINNNRKNCQEMTSVSLSKANDSSDTLYIYSTESSNEKFGNMTGLTQTTATLTPTTLKSFLDMQGGGIPLEPIHHQHEAGFVPPVINLKHSSYNNSLNDQVMSSLMSDDSIDDTDDSLSQQAWTIDSDPNDNSLSAMTPNIMIKRKSGRRSNRNEKLTPEEEERRRQRRERNKLAAARCRKRRLDHTNCLIRETEGLEEKRNALQSELQLLESQKKELEYLLESHKNNCKVNAAKASQLDIKPNLSDIKVGKISQCRRPNTLQVPSIYNSHSISDATGVPIQTPSNGIFNFESLLEGGTGLTPLLGPPTTSSASVNCSTQQRNMDCPDLSSPDGRGPPKLVSL